VIALGVHCLRLRKTSKSRFGQNLVKGVKAPNFSQFADAGSSLMRCCETIGLGGRALWLAQETTKPSATHSGSVSSVESLAALLTAKKLRDKNTQLMRLLRCSCASG
jgi:hypothetical protein